MDLVTKSLIREFSKEFEIENFDQSKQFEIMSAYLTVKRNYSESFNPTDIVSGGGNDLGIDAIGIIVNGQLVTEIDSLGEMLASKIDYLDVTFIFVQADRGSFDASKLGSFAYGVTQFFTPDTKEPRNQFIADAALMMTAIYDKGAKFKKGNPRCLMYYVTTGTWPVDGALNSRRDKFCSDLMALNAFREVDIQPIGASDISQLYRLSKHSLQRKFEFTKRSDVPEIPGVIEAFVGFIPATQFMSIVKDEGGSIVKSIFYDNVRDFQGGNEVNNEMYEALQSDRKRRFVLMNNGVTIITRGLQHTRETFTIEDFQIVNGCQTTHVLFASEETLDDTVLIPLRLIWTQDEDVISDIIRATNRQTEVKEDQFFASTEFARRLEDYFNSHDLNEKLHFERRSRQYDSIELEKTRIINQTNVVRAFASVFLEEPHSTVRSYNTLSERIGKEIFVEGHKLSAYYTAASAYYRLERLFHNGIIDRNLKVCRFQLLMTAKLLIEPKKPPYFNSNVMDKYCNPILEVLWDKEKSLELFNSAIDVLLELNGFLLDRDKIHTQGFTQKLIKRFRPDE
ncbi:AIPR family protein [Methylobacterium sp. Leaf469]|uniref:AIPR family protein n=1 Tax=Methylobacterium sp. Leaf469 TaxID=1736387 RepID=UPI0009EBD894|nr:AIPR family protein [Methylobacterium sp. Leaf469]